MPWPWQGLTQGRRTQLSRQPSMEGPSDTHLKKGVFTPRRGGHLLTHRSLKRLASREDLLKIKLFYNPCSSLETSETCCYAGMCFHIRHKRKRAIRRGGLAGWRRESGRKQLAPGSRPMRPATTRRRGSERRYLRKNTSKHPSIAALQRRSDVAGADSPDNETCGHF